MIHVSQLTKHFGPVRALDRVSFDVPEGAIVGFLGPNGAGKTTTIRILTGFLPPDEGEVTIAGIDARTDSLGVRRIIGYLPEGVPIYPEMRVREYLRFRARIKGVPRAERKAAIARALASAGVEDVNRQITGTLSKGYRQRVGLADALLGNPRVLILDEPTVGLDPEQVRQFRSLLRGLGGDRTILLSTHVLSEVEQVAARIIIIRRGRIAAHDTTQNLRKRVGSLDRIRAEISGGSKAEVSPPQLLAALEKLPGVVEVRLERGNGPFHAFILRPQGDQDLREAVFHLVRDRGWSLRELTRLPVTLEEAFIDIVGERPAVDNRPIVEREHSAAEGHQGKEPRA